MPESSLPLQGVRVLERSGALAGRLTGLLLADQGAAVFALDHDDAAEENIDQYLNRGKNLVPAHVLAADENADILIGDIGAARLPWQISLGFTAAVPGDEDCDVAPDASYDLLNGMIGFYTDLCIAGRLLGREVIYTPLPLCSVYAAVLGATAVCAALADRRRARHSDSAAGRRPLRDRRPGDGSRGHRAAPGPAQSSLAGAGARRRGAEGAGQRGAYGPANKSAQSNRWVLSKRGRPALDAGHDRQPQVRDPHVRSARAMGARAAARYRRCVSLRSGKQGGCRPEHSLASRHAG